MGRAKPFLVLFSNITLGSVSNENNSLKIGSNHSVEVVIVVLGAD